MAFWEKWFLIFSLWMLQLASSTSNNTTNSQGSWETSVLAVTMSSFSDGLDDLFDSGIPITSGDGTAGSGEVTSDLGEVTRAMNEIVVPKQLALCTIDFIEKEAHCNASRLLELTRVDLPDNITKLVVTRENFNVDQHFLGRALNTNNFTSLRNLERLTINNFGLQTLQNSTFAVLPFLEYLDLSGNQINGLTDVTFVGLNKLITLNLSRNEISVIRSEFFNLPSLRHLVLANNWFSTLPNGGFKLLRVLQTLNLDNNNLQSLSSGSAFLGLDHLQKLRLKNCNLHVPHTLFDHTQSVDTLSLANNGLRHIPSDAISQLYFLQSLDLSNNKISSLPNDGLQGLALRVLDLSNNSISKISKFAFRNFRVEELYLQNNLLNGVPQQALISLSRNLFILDLSGNRLGQDQIVFPADLTYLHSLNLSHSGLTYLPYSLKHLYQLHTLDLSNNYISSINESGMRLLRRLDSVSLSGNPWNCNCGLIYLQAWLKHQSSGQKTAAIPSKINTSSLICSRPDILSGVPVMDISQEHLARCSPTWDRGPLVAIYIVCGLAMAGLLGIFIFTLRKWPQVIYGCFCCRKTWKSEDHTTEGHSPIKVISNTGAGAEDLPALWHPEERHHGPIKNQAWESALVISNPHRNRHERVATTDQTCDIQAEQNGKVHGAETIL